MLRGTDKRLLLSERLTDVVGRELPSYPARKPGRIREALPPVAGYTAWYDLNDRDAVSFDANGMITSVLDKSGNGLTATATQVVSYAMTPSGRLVMFHDASDVTGQLASSASSSDVTSSAFVVACVMTFSVVRTLIGPSADGGNQLRITTAGRLETVKADVVSLGIQSNANISSDVPFVAGQVLTASDVTHYLGSTSETDAHAQTFTGSLSLVIGRSPGSTPGGQQNHGWIGEVLLYDTALASGDALATVAYLQSKWGIS